ncbi:MAG: hypothetical protein ACYS9X_00655 [Planctomycetota bacterium]
MVFALGQGYVALIPCHTKGMLSVPAAGNQAVEAGLGGYAVAIKRAGTNHAWVGGVLFCPDEGNIETVKRNVAGQLEGVI